MGAARATILVVDDDAELRDWLALELRRQDFDVVAAGSCEEAVAVLSQRRVDLALVDLWMPGRDGLQTLATLRVADGDLVVVMMTGHATVPAAVASMQNGAYDFVQKPFTMRELLPRLERALERRQLQGIIDLHSASARLMRARTTAELIQETLETARGVVVARALGVVTVPPATTSVRADPDEGPFRAPDALLLRLSERAVTDMAPVLVPQGPADRLWNRGAPAFTSAVAFPLAMREGPIGALVFLRGAEQPAFTATELRRGTVFASQVALALDNARLHDELQARIRDLTAARETVLRNEKLAVTGQMAAGVAHEVNNPLSYVVSNLNYIASTVGVLARELDAGHEPGTPADELSRRMSEVSQAAQEAREGAERIRLIVRDLKTFSRGDDDTRRPVDLRRVLDWALNILTAEYRHRARLVREVEEGLWVEGNEPRLGQVFVNLVVNALQAFRADDVTRNEVRVVARRDGAEVVVDVQDNGAGIAPELLSRIFEPFFTTKPIGVGTGLGLSICHEIVSAHGGRISVESTPGLGSAFRVALPAARTKAG